MGIVDLPTYIDTRFESKKKILYMYRSTISKSSYKICSLSKGGYIFFKGKEKYVQKNKTDGKRPKIGSILSKHTYMVNLLQY